MTTPATKRLLEAALLKDIQVACSKGDQRLWRNQVGEAWAGSAAQYGNGVIINRAYRVNFGLAVGSGDLIGGKSVTITPDMVGQRVMIFSSVEVKAKGGRQRLEQTAWRDTIRRLGGRAGFAYSIEEAWDIMNGVQK